MLISQIKSLIRDVPDFPKPGILFKDITPLFANAKLCSAIVDEFIVRLASKKVDAIVGVESRGFLFGILLANKMGIPFILVRKKGKLPFKTISHEYELEYGTAHMEMQVGDIQPNWNVVIHDDLLATGGTAAATAHLIASQQASVSAYAFLVELKFLNGRQKINPHSQNIISLVEY